MAWVARLACGDSLPARDTAGRPYGKPESQQKTKSGKPRALWLTCNVCQGQQKVVEVTWVP